MDSQTISILLWLVQLTKTFINSIQKFLSEFVKITTFANYETGKYHSTLSSMLPLNIRQTLSAIFCFHNCLPTDKSILHHG